MRSIVVAGALAWAGCFGAEVKVTDRILPFIQDGTGTSTAITIVNLESTPASFEVLFLSDTGAFWEVPVSVESDGAYVRGVLGAGRSVTFQTKGAGPDLRTGHAIIFSIENARLAVNMTVRGPGGAWTFNAAPQREDLLTLPFDNTGGAATSFLWVSDTPSTLVTYR